MNMAQTPESNIEAVAQVEHQLAEAHLQLDLETIDRLLHAAYIIMLVSH